MGEKIRESPVNEGDFPQGIKRSQTVFQRASDETGRRYWIKENHTRHNFKKSADLKKKNGTGKENDVYGTAHVLAEAAERENPKNSREKSLESPQGFKARNAY